MASVCQKLGMCQVFLLGSIRDVQVIAWTWYACVRISLHQWARQFQRTAILCQAAAAFIKSTKWNASQYKINLFPLHQNECCRKFKPMLNFMTNQQVKLLFICFLFTLSTVTNSVKTIWAFLSRLINPTFFPKHKWAQH